MPRPRKSLINLDETPYYHCVSRCVRRAYLCGKDRFTGHSYEHRRQWVEERLLFLARVFAIDVCAYAVMSNHTHVVLHVNRSSALAWSKEEVLIRWHKIHRGPSVTRRFLDPDVRPHMAESELQTIAEIVERYRKRLFDISWFMRLLNENIARQANKEDSCTGRFWEGRFKSQALMDEAALAACMAYVDLNPVRAGIADSPQNSDHTSAQLRINAAKENNQPKCLYPLVGDAASKREGVCFCLDDYLRLLEYTSRLFLQEKVACNEDTNFQTLKHNGVSLANWHELVAGVEKRFSNTISLKIASLRAKSRINRTAKNDYEYSWRI